MSKDAKRKDLPGYVERSVDNLEHLFGLVPSVCKEELGIGSPDEVFERLNVNFLGIGLKLINGDGEDFIIIVMDTGDDDEVRRRLVEYGKRSMSVDWCKSSQEVVEEKMSTDPDFFQQGDIPKKYLQ